jgi:hypothetical protein
MGKGDKYILKHPKTQTGGKNGIGLHLAAEQEHDAGRGEHVVRARINRNEWDFHDGIDLPAGP